MLACLFSGGELTLAIGYGVGLPKSEHKFLRDFAYDNDTDGMRVVSALLLELRDDPSLSPRVLGRTQKL